MNIPAEPQHTAYLPGRFGISVTVTHTFGRRTSIACLRLRQTYRLFVNVRPGLSTTPQRRLVCHVSMLSMYQSRRQFFVGFWIIEVVTGQRLSGLGYCFNCREGGVTTNCNIVCLAFCLITTSAPLPVEISCPVGRNIYFTVRPSIGNHFFAACFQTYRWSGTLRLNSRVTEGLATAKLVCGILYVSSKPFCWLLVGALGRDEIVQINCRY